MKFLPSKESMNTWEFILTVVITIIIAAELYFAWAGFYEAKDQFAVLKDLKTTSQEQAATLKTLTNEQTKSVESLKQMNSTLQTSVTKTSNMAAAMKKQLEILQQDQSTRLAEAARKPKLELYIASVPANTFFSVPLKTREETDTTSVFEVRLMNNGNAAAHHGILRAIVNAKDVSIVSTTGFQRAYEEKDSTVHVILISFDVIRAKGNFGLDITLTYPKHQAPFNLMFNVDADELDVTGTNLGVVTVKPRKPVE
jgi:hypothetical protein